MAEHQFRLGQMVAVRIVFPDRSQAGRYEIIRLMPQSVDGERHYRVRGPDNIERAIGESQIVAQHA